MNMTVEIDDIVFNRIDAFFRFPIYHSPDFFGIAMCRITDGDFHRDMILIGKEVDYFSKEELEVIYWHEVGHLAYDHLKEDDNKERMMKEYEADFFSMKEVGPDRLIQVLVKTLPLCRSEKGRIAVRKRIKRVLVAKNHLNQLAS